MCAKLFPQHCNTMTTEVWSNTLSHIVCPFISLRISFELLFISHHLLWTSPSSFINLKYLLSVIWTQVNVMQLCWSTSLLSHYMCLYEQQHWYQSNIFCSVVYTHIQTFASIFQNFTQRFWDSDFRNCVASKDSVFKQKKKAVIKKNYVKQKYILYIFMYSFGMACECTLCKCIL